MGGFVSHWHPYDGPVLKRIFVVLTHPSCARCLVPPYNLVGLPTRAIYAGYEYLLYVKEFGLLVVIGTQCTAVTQLRLW